MSKQETYVGSYLGVPMVFRMEGGELVLYPTASDKRIVVDKEYVEGVIDQELKELVERAIVFFS